MDDFELREMQGKQVDDIDWWNEHEKEIDFFFTTLQGLGFGYFERNYNERSVAFHTRADFKRFLLKRWEPVVLDI